MKFIRSIFYTLLVIVIYSLIISFLGELKFDFFKPNINLERFDWLNLFSIFFLSILYMSFSYFFPLMTIYIFLILYKDLILKLNVYILIGINIIIFTLLSFRFDSNFYDTTLSLSQFFYVFIIVIFTTLLIKSIEKKVSSL